MSSRTVAVALAIVFAVAVRAQSPVYLVKEINKTISPTSSRPDRFLTLGTLAFFHTTDYNGYPLELWRSDGTDFGTVRISERSQESVVWNGKVWFTSSDGNYPPKISLYSTDGTQTTQLPLPAGVNPGKLIPSGPALYLSTGDALWKTNGTTTTFVSSLSVANGPSALAGQSAIFASINYATYAQTIWRADTQLQSVMAVPNGLFATQFVSTGSLVYFTLYNSSSFQQQLWRTDGSPAGTFMIHGSFFGESAAAAQLYFTTEGKLWRTDGSLAGTVPIASSLPGASATFAATPMGVLANGTVIAAGQPLNPPQVPNQSFSGVWSVDGTNTTFLANVPNFNRPKGIATGNLFVFGSDDEVWRTDGTVGGTWKLADWSGDSGYTIWPMAVVGSTVFFSASDPVYGWELRKTDGTVANTVLVKDIAATTFASYPRGLRALNGGVVFAAQSEGDTSTSNGRVEDLWFSDGTEAGTQKILSHVTTTERTACGGRLYFTHDGGAGVGFELWSTNGTAAGTGMVRDLYPGSGTEYPNSGSPYWFACVDDRLYFYGRSESGMTLWRSDGTPAGTLPVYTFGPYGEELAIGPSPYGHGMFFGVRANYKGELWASDGTPGGTQKVKALPYDLDSYYGMLVAGYHAYFTVRDNQSNLWKTDGTAAGTVPVATPGTTFGTYEFGDRLAFGMHNFGSGPSGYCVTDGANVSCFDPYLAGSGPFDFSMVAMNGRLYYNKAELFTSDGVSSARVGTLSARKILSVAGGRLYYVGDTGYSDRPLMESDGTGAGTRTLFDARVFETVASGGRLFVAGEELYAYDLPVTSTTLSPRKVPLGGGQVVIQGRGFTGPVTVKVNDTPATVVSVTPTAITFAAPPRSPGTYRVTFVTGDGREMKTDQPVTYGCSSPTASVGAAPAPVCPLTPVQLQGGGGNRCSWFPAAGLDNPSSCSPIATVDKTTTYTLIVADGTSCQSTNHPTVTVTVYPPVNAEIVGLNNNLLPNNTYAASVADAGAGATYAWTVEGAQLSGSANQRTVSFTTGCAYPKLTVRVTNGNGCQGTSSRTFYVYSSLSLLTVSPRYTNAGSVISVPGSGLDCVLSVTLADQQVYREVPVSFTPVSATLVSFRLPANAPAVSRVRVTTAGGSMLAPGTIVRVMRDDFNSDGTTDLLLRNSNTGRTNVWSLNLGAATLTQTYRSDDTDYKVAAIYDFGWTRLADILWQRSSTRELSLQLTPAQTRILPRIPAAEFVVAAVGDLDGDGYPELIMRSTATGETQEWRLSSAWDAVSVKTIHAGNNLGWNLIGSRDFDGDGNHDILWRNASTGMTLIWFMKGSSIRASTVVHQGGNTDWTIAGLDDFDADTKTDILWRHVPSGMTLLWRMNGASIQQSVAIHNGGNQSWSIVGVGDFNADFRPDVLWRDGAAGTVLYWQMDVAQIKASVVLFNTLDPAEKIESPRM